jgi:hypothetical protein
MAPRGLGSFLMMPVVGTVLGRFDPRKVLAVRPDGRRLVPLCAGPR